MFGKLTSLIFSLLMVSILCASAMAQNRNTISGIVYDATDNRPVPNVYVELMNDVYATLQRIRTDGSGRFYFTNLSSGTFKVRVPPFGTNYLEESKDVEIVNIRAGNTTTSSNEYIDFYLRLDKRKISVTDPSNAGAVFVQNIPPPALEIYKKALTQLTNPVEAEAGLESLKKATELFPDYYDASLRLGIEYTNRNKFYESLPFLVKAVTVNTRSFLGYYTLGIAAFNIKAFDEAEKAFKAALVIAPQSDYANLQYGMTLRVMGKFKEAEVALLKAKASLKDAPADELHRQLALLYNRLSRNKEAVAELEICLKLISDPKKKKEIQELIVKIKSSEDYKKNS